MQTIILCHTLLCVPKAQRLWCCNDNYLAIKHFIAKSTFYGTHCIVINDFQKVCKRKTTIIVTSILITKVIQNNCILAEIILEWVVTTGRYCKVIAHRSEHLLCIVGFSCTGFALNKHNFQISICFESQRLAMYLPQFFQHCESFCLFADGKCVYVLEHLCITIIVEISNYLCSCYLRLKVKVGNNFIRRVLMLELLTIIAMYKIQKHVRFATFYLFDKLFAGMFHSFIIRIAKLKPLCNIFCISRRWMKVQVDMVMWSSIILVVKYVGPLFDGLILHHSLLYVNRQLVLVGYNFHVP